MGSRSRVSDPRLAAFLFCSADSASRSADATLLRSRLRIDDALDVFAVHGVGGLLGAVATGVFATAAIQAGYTGLLEGNVAQLVNQVIAVAATVAYAVVSTFVIVKLVDLVLGIRVKAADEEMGLDLAVHGEAAYQS